MWGEIEPAASEEVNSPEQNLISLRTDLLTAIASDPRAQFKSQQKDDPDWSQEQKKEMAEQALDKSPGQFLARYGALLQESHLDYFRDKYGPDHYEVAFQLKELGQASCQFVHRKRVRNRRYAALRNMIQAQDEYFSEEAMKARNPLLYQDLIGRHLTDQEKAVQDKINRSNCALSTIILDHMDLNAERERKKEQEAQQQEEFDSDEEEEEEEEEESGPVENEEEKRRLKDEFVRAMHQSFLDGKDRDFDYAKVDSDRSLDDLETLERDEEERYFDED